MSLREPTAQIQRIPELIGHIGIYLDQASLFACIRVSRLWHDVLLPALYYSLNDNECSWPKICSNLMPGKARYVSNHGWNEDFIRAVIHKNGSHIRHLTVRWAVFNNAAAAASSNNSCTNIQSLQVFGVDRAFRLLEQTCFTTYKNRSKATWDQVEPLLSPMFADQFKPIIYTQFYWSQQDWITFQRFWMLVYNNRQTLQRLRLHMSIGQMHALTEGFYDILASCPNLTRLENKYQPLDLQRLLDKMPQLHHLDDHFTFLNRGVLERSMPQIRTMRLEGHLPTRSFFLLLKYLPNLDQLFIGWNFTDFSERPGPILEETRVNLRGLHITSKTVEYASADSFIAASVLPWLPNLRELTLSHLGPSTAAAIPIHCRQFESFTEVLLSSSIHPHYQMRTTHNTIAVLLENCPNLKTINAIQHILHVDYLTNMTCPTWISANSLETLRCQIRGISRLSDPEETYTYHEALVHIMIDQPLSLEEEDALRVFKTGRDQQRLIYARLSQLTKLKTLDIGMEFRRLGAGYGRNQPYYKVGRKRYINYGQPLTDTLEFSLESGLDQLKTLKELEVFGFEGCNRRIGEDELKWMAETWPRLREMRGLQAGSLQGLERDIPTERLLRYMRRLRPGVRHQRYPTGKPIYD
ncbi:MAG: hypothetical protein J3R72DRAFT_153657 [Linnemannia gamsii]|nr:MAG: hypothetical protein J3R72DRAFT_153657 [Linnemannia gamsii]